MKKKLAWILMLAVVLTMVLPAFAMAASIQLGGNVGFMYAGSEVKLNPRLYGVHPAQLVWSSSDPASVSADGGLIRGLSEGRSVVTVTGGGASARCGVVVLPREIHLTSGQQYALPYGTVERYAVNNNRVIRVSNNGVVTAGYPGNALIRVSYGWQNLYISVNVTAGTSLPQSKAASLDCANSTNQIVLVEYQGGSKALLSIHQKQNGVWTELYSGGAYVGSNGIGKTREGDKKTPTGTYNLTRPFGIKANPGANSPYTQVTKYHYWCGTSGSPYYNQLVDGRIVNRAPASTDEYLINYKGYYNYCMFIDYNKNGEAGKGSCIFLHCTGSKKSTGGCIAVPENIMKNIIRWAQPGAKIVIK